MGKEKNNIRKNEEIEATEIRLINADDEQVGVVETKEALLQAESAGLDLVEIVPSAEPPVCHIIDYGKYIYQKSKKQAEAKKKQKKIQVKEIKLRLNTEVHDYQTKLRKIEQFLEDGNKVKVTIRFKGRETTHPERGYEMIDRIIADTEETSKLEARSSLVGKFMSMVLAPRKNRKEPG